MSTAPPIDPAEPDHEIARQLYAIWESAHGNAPAWEHITPREHRGWTRLAEEIAEQIHDRCEQAREEAIAAAELAIQALYAAER
jgi:hypothetical protein